jgi:hypothetical protein
MQEILQNRANEIAQRCGLVQRIRKLTGAAFIQTLVFGWLEAPDASYADLANTAQALGIDVSRQAIEQRMTPEAAETLKATLEEAASQVLTLKPQCLPLLKHFTGVYVQDSTWITLLDELHTIWKGASCRTQKNKAALKLQVRFDVLTGTFQHFQLTDGTTADTKAEEHFQPLPKGSLRLADLGYFSLAEFERLTQAGVFWITKFKAGCSLFDEQQEPFCLQKRLASETSDTVNLSCFIGASKRLPAHLVALRISEEEANKRRRYIRRDAKRRQTNPSEQRLKLAGWNIYITNIDTDQFTPEQIAALVRIRWQVELMFKSFKSIGKVHTSRSKKPYRVLCEVYAKLIAQLVRHWVMIAIGWRCILYNIIKTAELVGLYAPLITISFHKSKTALRRTLMDIKQTIINDDSRIRSIGKQITFRLLQNVENP